MTDTTDRVRAAAAELAGVLAELSIAEAELGGRTLLARAGVNLPGEVVREVMRTGRAVVRGAGFEVQFDETSVRWRADRADLAGRLHDLGWPRLADR